VNGPLVAVIERWLWLVYYFRPDRSGSVKSSNDGTLSLRSPDETYASIDFQVDYSTTSGTATRWTAERGGGYGYGDMTSTRHHQNESGPVDLTGPLCLFHVALLVTSHQRQKITIAPRSFRFRLHAVNSRLPILLAGEA
jgi:hypothetical protein